MDDMTMMSVQCNIILNNGYMCGLPPIGRCATCQRAFCMSHQGWTRLSGPYVDMCAPCAAAKQAEQDKPFQEAHAAYKYFESGAAQSDLLTVGVQPVDICEVSTHWERKGLFGRSDFVDVATPVGRGWILGEFKWRYTDLDTYRFGNFLTALLDAERKDAPDRVRENNGLVCVQPYSDGYKIHRNYKFAVGNANQVWRELMQAVKRLTGESS